MIPVTRLNNSTFWVSADHIEFLEATPDTIITLVSGKKIIVKESCDILRDMIVDYKRRCHQGPQTLPPATGEG